MAVDAVQDVVDLLKDVTNGINYDNIANTSANLHISPIYDNTKLDYVNADNINVYHIDDLDDDSDYYNRGKYHGNTKLSIQIIARERNNGDAGILPIRDEVKNVLERHRNWKEVDDTANWTHMYYMRGKDLSDKRNNFSKYVIDIEMIAVGVCRSN